MNEKQETDKKVRDNKKLNVCLDDILAQNLYFYLKCYPSVGINSQTLHSLLMYDSVHLMADGFLQADFGQWKESVSYLIENKHLIPIDQNDRTPSHLMLNYWTNDSGGVFGQYHDDVLNMCYAFRNQIPLVFSEEKESDLIKIINFASQIEEINTSLEDSYIVSNDTSVAKWTISYEIPNLIERTQRERSAILDSSPHNLRGLLDFSMKNQIWISPDELKELLMNPASHELKLQLRAMSQKFVNAHDVINHLRQEQLKLDIRISHSEYVIHAIALSLEFVPVPYMGMALEHIAKLMISAFAKKEHNWLVSLSAANNKIKKA